jgi:hypothetical protein
VTAIVCAFHADRAALAYCAGCGKALCPGCVVRLTAGNYCQACAEAPTHQPRAGPRAGARVWLWAALAIIALAAYVASRVL